MTACEWRNYRASRRHNPLTAYDCFADSCVMYAFDTDRALYIDDDSGDPVVFKTAVKRQLHQMVNLSFKQPSGTHRKLAVLFAPHDFHFARLDDGVWTEKFRQDVPRVMSTDEGGAPSSLHPEYQFDEYLFVTGPIVTPVGDRSRYNYNGNPRCTHREKPFRRK